VTAAAYRMSRPLPERPGDAADLDWCGAGWHLVRLVAICRLADEAGYL
jgi:hypothetical protein